MTVFYSKLCCAAIFLLFTATAGAAPFVFECAANGKLIYSDRPCGPFAQQLRVLAPYGWQYNAYPGQLRPGQQQMLNDIRVHKPTYSSQPQQGTGESYSDRMKRLNEERKNRAQERRHTQEYESRGTSPWR